MVCPYFYDWLKKSCNELNSLYGTNYDFSRFPLNVVEKHHYFRVCLKDDKPVGFIIATIGQHMFDYNIKILSQQLMFAETGTKAGYLLMQDFIDFGKLHSNHIITMIADYTNIKEKSLVKLGFKKLETAYRMEI